MEKKLNAEELAAKRWPVTYQRVPFSEDSSAMQRQPVENVLFSESLRRRVTEVAQPLQDRVEELEAALEKVIELQYSSRLDEAIDPARAILAKQK